MARTYSSLVIKSPHDHKSKAAPVRVSMVRTVVDEIRQLALSDTGRELGGILLGSCKTDTKRLEVKVEAFVEAHYTDAAQTSLTFTHKSWEQMNNERETRYPNLKVVGWFHTHPGFGVFLSNHDLFIHQNFFDLYWQIAYVIDPVGDYSGLFGWSNAQIIALPFEVEGALIPAVASPTRNIHLNSKQVMNYRTRILLCIMAIILILSFGWGAKLYQDMQSTPYPGQEFRDKPHTLSELAQVYITEIQEMANDLMETAHKVIYYIYPDSDNNSSDKDK